LRADQTIREHDVLDSVGERPRFTGQAKPPRPIRHAIEHVED
jgi:hypothetical protein